MSNSALFSHAIRALSMDAVEKANSGHPGMPMGMADIAERLWRHYLRHNPKNPTWWNRDRFVLSNGHGSMLLYSLLYLSGYDLSLDDLKQFRQLNSKTPGHPEVTDTPGVETTTGPLGQGIANAVGMALAEKLLAQQYNRDGFDVVDHFTYVFLGDGCLMEGISHEVCSLAGTLKLGKLIAFWDDNGISIDGEVGGWFTDDTAKRFSAYGWQVIEGVDGHDAKSIDHAIASARANSNQPTLICCKTTIGFGSPNKSGKASSHGAALGEAEIKQTKAALNWPHGPFEVPEDIKDAWDATEQGALVEGAWHQQFSEYQAAYPDLADEFSLRMQGDFSAQWPEFSAGALTTIVNDANAMATRKASLHALNALAPQLPALIGGSADLTGSNCTQWEKAKRITPDDVSGNYIEYGVREFGMFAMMNGLALHGGFIPFGGTFLVFSDYARNALRMAALMKLRTIFVFTHDSIGLGEDGPTHQPVEHLASLRLIPNLYVWRPCDSVETCVSWQFAVTSLDAPTALVLSRQTLPAQMRDQKAVDNLKKGGYVLRDHMDAHITLCATGSEVALAVKAAEVLAKEGVYARVVSMPCCELFLEQEAAYQVNVMAPEHPLVIIEAGKSDTWYKFVRHHQHVSVLGVETFGKSAPANALFDYFGLTVANVVTKAKLLLEPANVSLDATE